MKTLQEQYNLLKEGKGHKDVFMKSARRLFPEYVTNFATYKEAVTILKQKSIISEADGGVLPPPPKPSNPFANWAKFLAEEAKAEEKKTTKEVEEMETAGFDYKDPKNIDNLFGEQFLKGYYAEMKDPKNADKDVDELKEIVAKNLAKDRSYYVKNAAFGIKGIGYEEMPETKEVKGKFAASGMEPVKEGRVSLTDLLNEAIGGYIDMRPVGMNEESAKEKEEHFRDAEKDDAAHIADLEKDMEDDKKAEKKVKKSAKKESVETKLAEIEKQGKLVTMEAQMDALDELIASKQQRVEMVNEDDDLAELADKSKIKAMQKEIKDLEKRRTKMDKLYEKMCGKAYVKQEIVDEVEVSEEIED